MLALRALLFYLPALAVAACGSSPSDDTTAAPGTDSGPSPIEPVADGGVADACTSCPTGDGGGGVTDAATPKPARVLLFSGYVNSGGQGGYYDDTWEWSGTAWSEHSASGPSGRVAGSMASLNGEVVLFGGYNGKTHGDTWVWDGAKWSERKVPGPPARSSAAMARLGAKIVLFGGKSAAFGDLGDTWEWDGASWTERTVTGPSARSGATLAIDGNKAMLFGGQSQEVWSWDGATWTRITQAGGFGRANASSAVLGGSVYGFGGVAGGGCAADAWRWSGTNFVSVAALPKSVCGATVTGLGAEALLFGGSGYPDGIAAGHQYLANTWTFDGTTFSQRNVSGPPGRDRQMMTAY